MLKGDSKRWNTKVIGKADMKINLSVLEINIYDLKSEEVGLTLDKVYIGKQRFSNL